MSLLSLAKENSNEVLAVYLLSGTFIDKKKHYASLGEKERSFLEGMVQTYQKGSRVYFIDCSDLFVKELGNSVNLKNLYTPYAFMRLLMDLIPSLPDIVLYLDYDTVILSSLHSLYGTPLEGKDFAIAPDQIESRYFLKAKFNTGVMLLNLKQIRQDGCFKKARKAVNSKLMLMILLFIKKLREPITLEIAPSPIKDKFLLVSSLSCLSLCIILLVFSSFFSLPMWIISGASAAVLLLLSIGYGLVKKDKFPYLGRSLSRLPYTIIPFILAMFALVMALKENGITLQIASLLSHTDEVWGYGFASFLMCNAINNIPMSVLFTEVIRDGGVSLRAVYASIIGSNIGAFLSPVGALAGVMWMNILKRHERYDLGLFRTLG